MKVIVVGAGEVGFDVARILSQEQHDVIVIDVDPEALASVANRLDVMTLCGNGASASVLEKAGIQKTDMLIAVAAIDEVNIISCMMADRLGVDTTIARVRSGELSRTDAVVSARDFGIDLVIHPEDSAAAEVARLIRRASATDVLTFEDGRMQLIGMRVDKQSVVIGRALHQIVSDNPELLFRVMAIVRGIRTILPMGSEVLRFNDQVFVFAHQKDVPRVLKVMGKSESRLQKIMILGGSNVGAGLARQLSGEKNKYIKLVEPDRERAETLAEQLGNVLVIHGQGTDIDLLATEGLGEMDAFVAVTDDEESNLVTCLLAKHLGVQKTVALLSKGAYIPISQSIGLDAAVSTKLAVSREILQFLRGKHVKSAATVPGLDAEILEMVADRRSPVTAATVRELKLPKGLLIAAINHGNKLEIATGDTKIDAGDSVIVFVLPQLLAEAERLFSKS